VKRTILVGAMGAGLILCFIGADVRPAVLFDPSNLRAVGNFASGLFPPDLSPGFLKVVGLAALRTLAISIAGTALSIAIGLPLGILGTASLWRRGPLVEAEKRGLATSLFAAASVGARGVSRFLRAVPDLVWALLFVVGFGLGPLPGALALGVSYAGVLGRVYGDLFEAVPPGPVAALHAAGASRLQILAAAIWPQAAGSVAAYTLYSFECCVRSAAVLGFVGAGGIGAEINLSTRLFEYGQVTTLLAAFLVMVLAVDAGSRALRGKFRRSAVHGSGVLRDRLELRPARRGLGLLWAAALVIAFQQAGFAGISAPNLLPHLGRFAAQLVPPDLSPAFLGSLLGPLWQTVAISVAGTAIGIALGALLALPATSTLLLDDRDRARSLLARISRASIHAGSRALLALLRSIPELVWVLLCILAVGLGPFAGALALGLHTAGVLGKLYAETLEELEPAPAEELRAIGAGAWQRLAWAMWPQARETLASYTLLRWETNLRASTIVGLVGGGGLGLVLYNDVQLAFYPEAATLVLVIYLLVAATDGLADRLRRRRAPAAPVQEVQLLHEAAAALR
jgi:phosphonate transport system permease protein